MRSGSVGGRRRSAGVASLAREKVSTFFNRFTYLKRSELHDMEDITKSMQVSRRRGREEQEGRLSVRSTALNELRAMLPPVPSVVRGPSAEIFVPIRDRRLVLRLLCNFGQRMNYVSFPSRGTHADARERSRSWTDFRQHRPDG